MMSVFSTPIHYPDAELSSLRAVCFGEKQQIPILSLWFDQIGSTALQVSLLTITPLMPPSFVSNKMSYFYLKFQIKVYSWRSNYQGGITSVLPCHFCVCPKSEPACSVRDDHLFSVFNLSFHNEKNLVSKSKISKQDKILNSPKLSQLVKNFIYKIIDYKLSRDKILSASKKCSTCFYLSSQINL